MTQKGFPQTSEGLLWRLGRAAAFCSEDLQDRMRTLGGARELTCFAGHRSLTIAAASGYAG